MARSSNAQGLLFAEITTEDIRAEGATVNTLTGWFGAQLVGQMKSLITNAVNEHKGVVTHTVGDSILSSFADARAALNTALEIKRTVAQAQKPSIGTIAKVRIGLAYGPVRVLAGKVSGDSVTAAGLLLQRAQSDEILADQSMFDATGTVGKDIRFENCGLVDGIAAYRVVSLAAPQRGAFDTTTTRPVPAAAQARPAPTAAPAPTDAPAPPAPPAAPVAPVAAAAPVARSEGPKAVVLTYAGTERRFTAADGEVTIGRGKDVNIVVPEIHVSRKHAKIVWEDGVPYIVNLSQNGVCVRATGSDREQTCMEKMRLESSGEIALCAQFMQILSPTEIVGFSLIPD